MIDVGECTIDEELDATMNEINFIGEEIILIINTPTTSIKNKALGKVKGCIGLNPCKSRGLDKRKDN